MAYYDHAGAIHKQECAVQYNELKTRLQETDVLALEHINDMEKRLEEQSIMIAEYRSFFQLLNKLSI